MYKYFTEDEMKCTHCGSYEMDHDFMQKLDQLREDMGFVFPITSGYLVRRLRGRIQLARQQT